MSDGCDPLRWATAEAKKRIAELEREAKVLKRMIDLAMGSDEIEYYRSLAEQEVK